MKILHFLILLNDVKSRENNDSNIFPRYALCSYFFRIEHSVKNDEHSTVLSSPIDLRHAITTYNKTIKVLSLAKKK